MNKIMRYFPHRLPHFIGIVFVLFISLFALDVFDSGLNFWESILGLFMHLIPSIVLAIAIAVAWRREWVGAVAFMGWAVFYVTSMRGFDWIAYAIIAGIPFVVGVLFLVDWIWREKVHT